MVRSKYTSLSAFVIVLIGFLTFTSVISCKNHTGYEKTPNNRDSNCEELEKRANDLIFHSIGRLEIENRRLGVLDSAEKLYVASVKCQQSGLSEYYNLIRFLYIKHDHERVLLILDTIPQNVKNQESGLYWQKHKMINAFFVSDSLDLYKGWVTLDSLFILQHPDHLTNFNLAYERLGFLLLYSRDMKALESNLRQYSDQDFYDSLRHSITEISEENFFKSSYVDQVRSSNGL